jgi:hypothetical protein
MKENFVAVDGEDVLARLRNVPISIWNYKSQNANVRHIGPMAQDFAAAFRVGDDDKHISTVDPDGVALAGLKALDDRTVAQESRIHALERENAELRKRLERLEKVIDAQQPKEK